jgi:Glycosyltransferases, probably involved in cell wall biogenesis
MSELIPMENHLPRPLDQALVDVVIPVYNEEQEVASSVLRLKAYLDASFPYDFRIIIADNASTDSTLEIAQRLADRHERVQVVHLDAKGRGRALRQVWLDSDADVVAYMDVDLSTDLKALLPLVAPLVSGHSDVAIGSRLSRGSRVVRGAKREFISRSYNLILRASLRASFRDAQCGFKGMRRDAADLLLPLVEDNNWFFDTELLVLAERSGLRIHEVPVDWTDDPGSTVDIVATALEDLRGVARLRRGLRRESIPLQQVRDRLGRTRVPTRLRVLESAGVSSVSTSNR